jgi:hypothetical protein
MPGSRSGYYDRTLATVAQKPLTIGVLFWLRLCADRFGEDQTLPWGILFHLWSTRLHIGAEASAALSPEYASSETWLHPGEGGLLGMAVRS